MQQKLVVSAQPGPVLSVNKRDRFMQILKQLLHTVGHEEEKIVLAEVLITLRLEGIVGKTLSSQDTKLLHTIKDAILNTPEKREEALVIAQTLLGA